MTILITHKTDVPTKYIYTSIKLEKKITTKRVPILIPENGKQQRSKAHTNIDTNPK